MKEISSTIKKRPRSITWSLFFTQDISLTKKEQNREDNGKILGMLFENEKDKIEKSLEKSIKTLAEIRRIDEQRKIAAK